MTSQTSLSVILAPSSYHFTLCSSKPDSFNFHLQLRSLSLLYLLVSASFHLTYTSQVQPHYWNSRLSLPFESSGDPLCIGTMFESPSTFSGNSRSQLYHGQPCREHRREGISFNSPATAIFLHALTNPCQKGLPGEEAYLGKA